MLGPLEIDGSGLIRDGVAISAARISFLASYCCGKGWGTLGGRSATPESCLSFAVSLARLNRTTLQILTENGGECLLPLWWLGTIAHMDARMPLIILTLMLCPSLAKAGLMVHSQLGSSVSQASGPASILGVVPEGEGEHQEQIQRTIPVKGLATSASDTTGSTASLDGVKPPLPTAELRWQFSIGNSRLPHPPNYRSLLKPS